MLRISRFLACVVIICTGHLLLTTIAGQEEQTCDVANFEGWTLVSESKGQYKIKTYNKYIENSPLLAFRGVAVMPLPIHQILTVLSDASVAKEWVDLLVRMEMVTDPLSPSSADIQRKKTLDNEEDKNYEDFDKNDKEEETIVTSEIVYQYYGLPLFVSDRDFVFNRSWSFTPSTKRVIVDYQSIEGMTHLFTAEDSWTKRKNKGVIRAESPLTRWIFESFGEDATYVDVETLVDNKGSLPAWLVNLIQGSWPYKTLSALQKLSSQKERVSASMKLNQVAERVGVMNW